jgi:hypothetical protein
LKSRKEIDEVIAMGIADKEDNVIEKCTAYS